MTGSGRSRRSRPGWAPDPELVERALGELECCELLQSGDAADAVDLSGSLERRLSRRGMHTGQSGSQVSLYIASGTTSLHYDFVDTTSPGNNAMATINTNGASFNCNTGDQFTLTFTFLSG